MRHLSNFNSFNNQIIIEDLPVKFQAYVEKLRNSDRNTPLARLAKSKMTEDGKYLLIEGNLINVISGKLAPLSESNNLKFIPTQLPLVNPKLVLNEEFSLSDLNPMNWSTSTILHSIADVASVAADFIVTGSGAVIDAANALSYLIEAQFEDNPEEKQMLYIMAIVTFGFIFLPFVPAGPVKAWIKGGGKAVSSSILNILKGIWMVFDGLLLKIPSYLIGLLKSPVVTKVLGNKAAKATGAITTFKNTAKKTFKEFLEKRGIKIGEALPLSQLKASAKATTSKAAKVAAKEGSSVASKAFAKVLPKIKEGPKIMAKMGFVTGKTYRYAFQVGGKNIMGKATIKNITEEGVEVSIKYASGRTVTRVESVSRFMLRSTVLPFQRIARFTGKAAMVPLFVKRFIDSLGPDGTVDEKSLLEMKPLNPDEVVIQSEDFGREIAQYEGDAGQYTVNQVVDFVQTALGSVDNKYTTIMSDNGRLSDPFDGKFGPLTKSALTQYQTDNKLEATGKMDVKTVISITNKLAATNKDPKLVQDLQGLTKGQESNLGLDLLNQAIEAGSKNPPAEKPKADQIIRKPDIGKI